MPDPCKCGTRNPIASNYCMNCGEALTDVAKNEINSLREEIKEITQKLEYENTKLTDCTAEFEKKRDKLEKIKQDNEILEKENTEKNSRIEELKEQLLFQQAHQKNSIIPWIITIVFAVLLVILGVRGCDRQHELETQLNSSKNEIKPLQSEHDFTPQIYKVKVDKAYLYDNNFDRINLHISDDEKVIIVRIKGNFGYGVSGNNNDIKTLGWMRLADIKAIN